MATEIVEKKKHDQEQVVEGKSKRLKHASLDSFCGIFLPPQQLVTFILKKPFLYLCV